MEPKRRVLRSAAVVNAVVLVGCFVVCGSATVFSLGTKSAPVFSHFPVTKPPPAPQPAPESPKYMSGSKSTFIFVGPGVKPPVEVAPAPHEPAPVKPGE